MLLVGWLAGLVEQAVSKIMEDIKPFKSPNINHLRSQGQTQKRSCRLSLYCGEIFVQVTVVIVLSSRALSFNYQTN